MKLLDIVSYLFFIHQIYMNFFFINSNACWIHFCDILDTWICDWHLL